MGQSIEVKPESIVEYNSLLLSLKVELPFSEYNFIDSSGASSEALKLLYSSLVVMVEVYNQMLLESYQYFNKTITNFKEVDHIAKIT